MTLDLSALWKEAEESFAAGEYDAAETSCQRLIALAPGKPMAYSLLSRLCRLKGQVRPAARNAFEASQRVSGAHWKEIIAISSTLLEVGENHLAHSVLSFINPHDPANRDGLLELGRQYSALDDQLRALHCIEQAQASGCTGWFASHLHGIVLGRTGRVEHAVAACEDSATKNPKYGHAHWSRAQFGLKEGAESRIARMRDALTLPGLGNDDVTCMHYALFKELDTLDRTDEAWRSLMAGANARRSVTEYSAEKENAAFDALMRVTADRFLERRGDVPTEVTPIFVVGLPRTGTTLLERILGSHPHIATGGALDDFRQQMQWVNNVRLPNELDGNFGNFVAHLNYTVLGRRYLEKTRWLTGSKPFYSDRHPMNFMLCGLIMRALPHAKIIHLRRHPMDSCFSSLKELFAKGYYPYSYALDELAVHYSNYRRLMRHWHRIAPGRILDVRYEDLVAEPEAQAQRVQEYLGVPNVETVTDLLAGKDGSTTARTLHLRQPFHTGHIGGWRRYAQGLAPLQVLLSGYIDEYEAE